MRIYDDTIVRDKIAPYRFNNIACDMKRSLSSRNPHFVPDGLKNAKKNGKVDNTRYRIEGTVIDE